MKPTGTFEDLYVWKEAILLARDLYGLFQNSPMYSLKSQIERASLSISTNISEGFELGSKKQFIRHLHIAKGSCGEVRSCLYFALAADLFPSEQLLPYVERCKRLSIMLYNLIRSQKQME